LPLVSFSLSISPPPSLSLPLPRLFHAGLCPRSPQAPWVCSRHFLVFFPSGCARAVSFLLLCPRSLSLSCALSRSRSRSRSPAHPLRPLLLSLHRLTLTTVFTTASHWTAKDYCNGGGPLCVWYVTWLVMMYEYCLFFTTGSYWAARQQYDTWPLLGVGYATWFVAWFLLSRLA
jgi:hypothetical protein